MHIDALAAYYDVDYPVEDEEKRQKKREKEEKKAEEATPEERAEARKKARTKRASRSRAYIKALEEILWDYPEDIETKALLANFLWMARSAGLTTDSRGTVEALLQQVFAVEPMHPAHHYRIHLWDAKDSAARVVDSAIKAGLSWPSVAHQWHMGGHIFAGSAATRTPPGSRRPRRASTTRT